MAATVEQLEKIVGKEYAVVPVSSSLLHPILADPLHLHGPRLVGTREISSPTPLELVPSRPRSNSSTVRSPRSSLLLARNPNLPLSVRQNLVRFVNSSPTALCAHHPDFRPILRCLPYISRFALPQRFGLATSVAPFIHPKKTALV